jgi:hypothetical protein
VASLIFRNSRNKERIWWECRGTVDTFTSDARGQVGEEWATSGKGYMGMKCRFTCVAWCDGSSKLVVNVKSGEGIVTNEFDSDVLCGQIWAHALCTFIAGGQS